MNITRKAHTLEVDNTIYLKGSKITQIAVAGDLILAFDYNSKQLSLINQESKGVKKIKWSNKSMVAGLRASPNYDEKMNPYFYARTSKSILLIDSQTHQATVILKAEGNEY